MKKSMKKTLKKTEFLDPTEVTASIEREKLEKKLAEMGDQDLFFEDTVGKTQSRKNKKTRHEVELTSTFTEKPKAWVPPMKTPKPFKPSLNGKAHQRNMKKRASQKEAKEALKQQQKQQVSVAESDDEMVDMDEDEEMTEEDLAAIMMGLDEEDFEEDGFDEDDELELSEGEGLQGETVRKVTPNSILQSYFSGRHIDSTMVRKGDTDLWDDDDDQNSAETKIKDNRKLAQFEQHAAFLEEDIASLPKRLRQSSMNAHVIKRGTVVVPSGLSVNPHPKALKAIIDEASRRAMREQEIEDMKARVINGVVHIPQTKNLSETELAEIRKQYEAVQVQPVKVVNRTNAQKNKLKREKLEKYRSHLRAAAQAQSAQVNNIDKIVKQVDGRIKYLQRRKAEKEAQNELMGPQTISRMGNTRFKPAFPEVYTADQLNQGDLRTAKQSTNIVGDIFHNLQATNKIAVTTKRKGYQPWTKEKIRRDMNWEEINVDAVVSRVESEALKKPKTFGPTKNKALKRKRGEESADLDSDVWK